MIWYTASGDTITIDHGAVYITPADGGARAYTCSNNADCASFLAAGVDVECREYEGAFHAFVVLPFVADAKDAWAFVHSRLRVLF